MLFSCNYTPSLEQIALLRFHNIRCLPKSGVFCEWQVAPCRLRFSSQHELEVPSLRPESERLPRKYGGGVRRSRRRKGADDITHSQRPTRRRQEPKTKSNSRLQTALQSHGSAHRPGMEKPSRLSHVGSSLSHTNFFLIGRSPPLNFC